MVGPATSAETPASATVTYAKASDRGPSFQARGGTGITALTSWAVEWDFPAGSKVASGWNVAASPAPRTAGRR